jgi:hypothetical protein
MLEPLSVQGLTRIAVRHRDASGGAVVVSSRLGMLDERVLEDSHSCVNSRNLGGQATRNLSPKAGLSSPRIREDTHKMRANPIKHVQEPHRRYEAIHPSVKPDSRTKFGRLLGVWSPTSATQAAILISVRAAYRAARSEV